MYGIPDGELPSVGKLEMAWVQTPLPPVNLNATKSEMDVVKHENDNDVMALDSSPVRGGGNHHHGHGHGMGDDLDYDVAEDYVT